MLKELGTAVPVYTTRKSGDGYTMTYSISAWIPFLTMFLFFINAIVWGIIGLVVAWRVMF